MKQFITLFALMLLFSACDINTAEPDKKTTTGTGNNEAIVYKIENTGSKLLTYKLYTSTKGYINDTGVALTGTLPPGDRKHFTAAQLTKKSNNEMYYLDWYSNDAKYSAEFDKLNESAIEIKEKKSTSDDDTVSRTIGSSKANNKRMALYGTTVSPIWYDKDNPNDKTYTITRGGVVTYKAYGKTFTGKMVFHAPKGGKDYVICDFMFDKNSTPTPPLDANVYLAVGEGFSVPYGGIIMAEVDYDDKETGRIFRRR